MRALLTTDLHLSLPWFEWLIRKAPSFDLVCIAGDFLDLFSKEPKPKQVAQVQGHLRDLASKTNVALCSGNHDSYGPIVPAARGPTYHWLADLDEIQRIISDGQTRIIGDLIISTLPYCANEQAKRILLDRGRSIRKSRGLKWLSSTTNHRLLNSQNHLSRRQDYYSPSIDQTSGSADMCMICHTNSEPVVP